MKRPNIKVLINIDFKNFDLWMFLGSSGRSRPDHKVSGTQSGKISNENGPKPNFSRGFSHSEPSQNFVQIRHCGRGGWGSERKRPWDISGYKIDL